MKSKKSGKQQIVALSDEAFEALKMHADRYEIIRAEPEMNQRERGAIVRDLFLDAQKLWGTEEHYENRSKLLDKWAIDMDAAIKEHLDHCSIGAFILLINEMHETALQTEKAYARHTETDAIKAVVFEWLDVNRLNFKSMDATAEAIAELQPVVFTTARKWVGHWKKLRSAGRP